MELAAVNALDKGFDLLGGSLAQWVDLRLLLRGGRRRGLCLPFILAHNRHDTRIVRFRKSLTPQEAHTNVRPFGKVLGRLKSHMNVPGIAVYGDEMVGDVSDIGADLASSNGVSFLRPGLERPIDPVQDMDILFHQNISAESPIEEPIADLGFLRRHPGLCFSFEIPGQVITLHAGYVSNRSLVNPSHHLLVFRGIPYLEAHVDALLTLHLLG